MLTKGSTASESMLWLGLVRQVTARITTAAVRPMVTAFGESLLAGAGLGIHSSESPAVCRLSFRTRIPDGCLEEAISVQQASPEAPQSHHDGNETSRGGIRQAHVR